MKYYVLNFLFITTLILAGYFYQDKIIDLLNNSQLKDLLIIKSEILNKSTTLLEIKKEIKIANPLRGPINVAPKLLSVDEVLVWTNSHRVQNNNLPPLIFNEKLASAARLKAVDMFNLQYFAHYSPSDVGPGDLANQVNYEFIAFGENLALGNFEDSKTLVQAWMDSPGHRANILNNRFTEIGVAVLKSIYEGDEVWMAVQEFGKPLSDCPSIDNDLNNQIKNNDAELGRLKEELNQKKQAIDEWEEQRKEEENRGFNRGRVNQEEYMSRVDEYNRLVNIYNDLAQSMKEMIDRYNQQIVTFNQCIVN